MTKYETLRKALEHRIANLSADEKLPGEVELSEEYSVSRMTVNKVITKLAEEGLVYRRKKAGTFVSGHEQRNSPIYLLIPCPNFLEQSTAGSAIYWRLMNCLHTVTLGKVMPVVLVAVSPTNSEHDIDTKNLEIIEPGGTVVCLSFWYRKTFPWLMKRNCNVVYVNNQIAEDIFDITDKWHYITLDARQAAADVVRRFKDCECKNPAFISMQYNNKATKLQHPFVDGWERGMGLVYPHLDNENRQIKFYPEEDSSEQLALKIDDFLDCNSCDAIFISNEEMLEPCWQILKKRGLDVPKDIVLITHQSNGQYLDYPTAYFDFPIFQMAEQILCMSNENKRQTKFISAQFHRLEYLRKQSVIDKPMSLTNHKTRNFNLEMNHI